MLFQNIKEPCRLDFAEKLYKNFYKHKYIKGANIANV